MQAEPLGGGGGPHCRDALPSSGAAFVGRGGRRCGAESDFPVRAAVDTCVCVHARLRVRSSGKNMDFIPHKGKIPKVRLERICVPGIVPTDGKGTRKKTGWVGASSQVRGVLLLAVKLKRGLARTGGLEVLRQSIAVDRAAVRSANEHGGRPSTQRWG